MIYYQAGISLVCTSSRMNWQTHLKIQGKAGIMTISSRVMDLGYLFLVILEQLKVQSVLRRKHRFSVPDKEQL